MTLNAGEHYPFSDMALSRRLERAEAHSNARFVDARAKLFPSSGARWIEVAGAFAMFDGPASPLTQTFGLGLFEPVTDRHMEMMEGFFLERDAPVAHEVSPLAHAELLTLLNARGYQPLELTSVMFRPIARGMTCVETRNHRLRARPADPGESEVWEELSVRGWSEFPELADFMRKMTETRMASDALPFLAELDGRPIATGALCVCDGVALLAGASTIPEGRRQGAQIALLDARLRWAAEHGCDLAMMCAQPGASSQRNAERHGFRVAYTRMKWRLAAQQSGPSHSEDASDRS